MGYALKIQSNKVDLVEIDKVDLKFLREQIGCQWVEAIPCPYGYVVVDEEYLLNNPPSINLIASKITNAFVNGIALLLDTNESDFIPFSNSEAKQIKEKLLSNNDSKSNK